MGVNTNEICGYRLWLVLAGVALLATACQAETTPVEVARAFMGAVESLDADQASSLVCEAQKGRVQAILDAFAGNIAAEEAFDLVFEDLAIEEVSNDGTVAVVHVSGAMTVSFLGQQDSQPVNEDHRLVKEGNGWVVCDP